MENKEKLCKVEVKALEAMMDDPDFLFRCRWCMHIAYTPDIKKLLTYDCPACGSRPESNWILIGKGNWKKYEQETKDN